MKKIAVFIVFFTTFSFLFGFNQIKKKVNENEILLQLNAENLGLFGNIAISEEGGGISDPEKGFLLISEELFENFLLNDDFAVIINNSQVTFCKKYLVDDFQNQICEGEDDPLEEGESKYMCFIHSKLKKLNLYQLICVEKSLQVCQLNQLYNFDTHSFLLKTVDKEWTCEKRFVLIELDYKTFKSLIDSVYDKQPFEQENFTIFVKY